MNLTTFKSAQKIQNRLSEIALQLTLLSNEDNNYIMSFYDKTTMNEMMVIQLILIIVIKKLNYLKLKVN